MFTSTSAINIGNNLKITDGWLLSVQTLSFKKTLKRQETETKRIQINIINVDGMTPL